MNKDQNIFQQQQKCLQMMNDLGDSQEMTRRQFFYSCSESFENQQAHLHKICAFRSFDTHFSYFHMVFLILYTLRDNQSQIFYTYMKKEDSGQEKVKKKKYVLKHPDNEPIKPPSTKEHEQTHLNDPLPYEKKKRYVKIPKDEQQPETERYEPKQHYPQARQKYQKEREIPYQRFNNQREERARDQNPNRRNHNRTRFPKEQQKREQRTQNIREHPEGGRYQNNKEHREKREYNKEDRRPQYDGNRDNKPPWLRCQKYMENMVPLQSKGLEEHLKKLKKVFMAENHEITNLRVYSSKYFPMLIFEYNESKDSIKITTKHFGEVLRESKKLKEKRSLFQEIFERLFLKVDKKYYNIAVFLVQKARERNIKNLTKNSIFNLDEGHDVMFYYMTNKNQTKINFIVFDCFLRNLQMDSFQIQELQHKHPDQFKIYKQFKKKVLQKEDEQNIIMTDLLDKEEASSDEDERPNFEERPLDELKMELETILNKNLVTQEDMLEKLNNELMTEAQNNSTDSDKFKVLDEKTEDLQAAIDNFNDTRNNILQKYFDNENINSKTFAKKSLKKIIIAEKQLESGLPIIGKKRRIFEMLKKQNLLIIEGETGSGKSTQLPQMLCEYYELFDDPKARPVLVTQPRRLATRSLAERVAKEMGESVGGFVDYVASAGKQVSQEAKIIFKLDRIVLDELTEDPILSKYSCLVIDEAHERTISIDVILGLIKELLTKRKDFKIIVTSASMDIALFQSYFGSKTLKVSGRMYPVTIVHKDYKNYMEGDKYQLVRKIERVINEEILTTSGGSMRKQYQGHLLCFCSQVDEIEKLTEIYSKKLNSNMFAVFPLHGKISPSEQKKVFEEIGKHKFIFASRIAETAITIDGVKVVIDPGKDIELIYDQKYKYSSMKLQDITRSSAKQRAGRAGRTGPGFCFRIYSEDNLKKRAMNKTPEIQNSSLQTVVLRLKTLRIKDVINFPYISKPSKEGLQTSLELLKLIGTLRGHNEEVTQIGHLLIKIPIQPFLSRAIVESMMFQRIINHPKYSKNMKLPSNQLENLQREGLTNTIISILALVVNFSNLFFIRKNERQQGQSTKYEFSDEEGDFFFLENVFKKYRNMKMKGQKKEIYNWVNNNFLSFKALNQTEDLINQIKKIAFGFDINDRLYENELDNVQSKLMECKSRRDVILSCLITSFGPNICKFSGNSHLGYTMVSQRKPLRIYGMSNLDLLGKNPQWIVCYDLHTNEAGRLYCKMAHQITYDFMKKHLDKFVWQKFDIEGIQKKNPFYKQIIKQFPTKIIQQFKFDYNKSQEDKKYSFLQESYPLISEQRNRVTFFIEETKNKQKDFDRETDFEEKLAKYEMTIINQLMGNYRHNYIGNVFACLYDGFEVKNIEFNNKEFCFQVIAPPLIIDILQDDCQLYGRSFVESIEQKKKYSQNRMYIPENKKKFKIFIDEEQNREYFKNYLQIVRSSYFGTQQSGMEVIQNLVDKRRKIPKTKILLHYFAGEASKNNLFAHYDLDKEKDGVDAQDMIALILEGIRKENYRSFLNNKDFKVTRSGNGINIYPKRGRGIVYSDHDEYEVAEELYRMDKLGLFGHTFRMPKFIRKFRDPVISQASKSNDDWKQKITKLLEDAKIKKENVIINVRGFYKPQYDKKKPPSEFQKSLRVQMHAQVITLDGSVFQRLKQRYDGQRGILGCEKVHVRVNYEQILGTAAWKAFDSMKDEFEMQQLYFKQEYPLLTINPVTKVIRRASKVFIYAHSPNRGDFLKPMRIFFNLFTPKIIKLEYSEYRFLCKMDEGQKILQKLEEQYKYKIYFGFDRFNNFLKVYCQDKELKPIQQKIKQDIKKCKYYTERISYRGKNLNRVKEVLDQYKQNNQKQEMSYEISFEKRQVIVTTSIDIFEVIKNAILKLVDSDKKQCDICADVMRNPYKLMNCDCSFCWLCLAEHVRMYRDSSASELLCCPNLNCKSAININDIRALISEEEFQKICDIKINKFLQTQGKRYLACKYCQNVFDRREVEEEGEINCQVCGKVECLKCGESHPNYTCQEWKNKDNLNDTMNRLGIKKCPKCNTGIQKNGGCNHMECTNCRAHICWKCLKTFDQAGKCYDHLAKQCGGIFDQNNY